MTIQSIIKLLKRSGINSKQLVINRLNNLNKDELLELRRDITIKICEKEVESHDYT